jgi:hypothetical protein
MAGPRKSGKGKKCPRCGAPRFQQYGQIFKCSGCDERGWYDKAPPRPGGGKGDRCHLCEANTLHRIYNRKQGEERLTIRACVGCGSVVFSRTEA